MTHERNERSLYYDYSRAFGLTPNEELFNRVMDSRFQTLLADPRFTIDAPHVDSNAYGEFLFITLRCVDGDKTHALTFYGLGFHERRERWFTEEWHWYPSSFPIRFQAVVTLESARAALEQRRADIRPEMEETAPSARAILFEWLADLTDEDGAATELDDLGDLDLFE